MTQIGENIKNARKKLDITQEELAEKINVTRQAVSNWENGKTEPDIETISAIAEILGIDLYELINNKSARKSDDYKKNKFFPSALIFGTLALLGLIFSLILEKPAAILRDEYFKAELLIALDYIIKPLTGLFLGFSLALFIKIATNFYIKNIFLRVSVLILGIVSAILSTCFIIYFLFVITTDLHIPVHFSNVIFYYQQKMVIENPIVHALAPVLIFYGINFEKEGKKYDKNI